LSKNEPRVLIKKIVLAYYPFGCHEWTVIISAALRHRTHVAAMASHWQRAGDQPPAPGADVLSLAPSDHLILFIS